MLVDSWIVIATQRPGDPQNINREICSISYEKGWDDWCTGGRERENRPNGRRRLSCVCRVRIGPVTQCRDHPFSQFHCCVGQSALLLSSSHHHPLSPPTWPLRPRRRPQRSPADPRNGTVSPPPPRASPSHRATADGPANSSSRISKYVCCSSRI